MTVEARDVSTPPQIRRIHNFEETLRYPLSKSRNNRRAKHVSSSQMFPPIEEQPLKSPRRAPPPTPRTRPSTAEFFEAAKEFHANKGVNRQLRDKLMESHMMFMNWRVPVSRPTSVMSSRSSVSRPGTSAQRLTEAKESAQKSPYTREEMPKLESEKLLNGKENKPAASPSTKAPQLSEKEEAILRDWLHQASVAEKIVLANLIESADRLTLTSVTGRKYRPGMAEAINMWLGKANPAEKDIAERFLEDLSLLESLGTSPKRRPLTSGFGPLIERPAELGYRDVKTDRDIEALFDSLSSELQLSLTKPFSKTSPQLGSKKTPAALWHLDQERDRRRLVENNTSNFVNPNRDRGTHFEIHPDWPCVN